MLVEFLWKVNWEEGEKRGDEACGWWDSVTRRLNVPPTHNLYPTNPSKSDKPPMVSPRRKKGSENKNKNKKYSQFHKQP